MSLAILTEHSSARIFEGFLKNFIPQKDKYAGVCRVISMEVLLRMSD